MARNRDLFDDTTMTFGEHLEVLRVHVWRSLIGITLGVVICLFFGDKIIGVLREPINAALKRHNQPLAQDDVSDVQFWEFIKHYFSGEPKPETGKEDPALGAPQPNDEVEVQVPVESLIEALRAVAPDLVPERPAERAPSGAAAPATSDVADGTEPDAEDAADAEAKPSVRLLIRAKEFAQFRRTTERFNRPVTFKVEEAFMAYLKVSMIAGLVLASPWVFYQIWLFVAAGLYPHERKYVYIYLPMSLFFFLSGVLFCFYFVFPIVLDFLISFNAWLELELQPRLSEYISLALMLPLMFGVSFQLPMVMLFLERLGIFTAQGFRENRRMAILVISVVSMLLTPSDPQSMVLMMVPLIFLYEVGIYLCRLQLTGSRDPLA